MLSVRPDIPKTASLVVLCVLGMAGAAGAREPVPLRLVGPMGTPIWSDRTLQVAVEIDRDQARILAFTVKDRPFMGAAALPAIQPYAFGGSVQADVVLHGPDGSSLTQRVDIGRLCLDHDASEAGHVLGDTILLHRDSFIVEMPELADFDVVEVAYFAGDAAAHVRVPLGMHRLDAAQFTPAGGPARYETLAFGRSSRERGGPDLEPDPPEPLTASLVQWPEDLADPDIYSVYGDEAEASKRINIVMVPDGYTYAEKATLRAHADSVVAYLRGVTPYKEHDRFINYTLVYAYSAESGTDQCDCGVVADTPMTTYFPNSTPSCGSSDNRCLYYNGGTGDSCDTNTSANIVAAELRAPAQDTTLILVNTTRYGGCAGGRAVFSAANGSAYEIAVHELGHSLARLDDEYAYNSTCRVGREGINTSADGSIGSWPEWIDDLGPPREGAKYYQQCMFRPIGNCEMRALNGAFCPVCNQQWALTFFGHSRVAPTAPIASKWPDSSIGVQRGVPVTFSVQTRLASGAGITNSIVWTLQGPGLPGITAIAGGSPTLDWTFTRPGSFILTCEVIADTNFVKPEKFGANRDAVTWNVDVCCCEQAPAFAGLLSATDLDPCAATGIELLFDPAGFGPSGGDYHVWRDGAIVAVWPPGIPFVDRPPDDRLHAYKVTAVSADCALASAASVVLQAADLVGASDPPPLGAVLRVAKSAPDALLSWADAAGVSTYEAARSDTRGFFGPITSVGTAISGNPGIADPGALLRPGLRTYRVRAEACGRFSQY